MFANNQSMGILGAFPDVTKTPSGPGPVPVPLPNLASGSGKGDAGAKISLNPEFLKWSKELDAKKAEADQVGKQIGKAIVGLTTYVVKSGKAIGQVEKTLERITQLQATQKTILKNAAKLEGDVAKAFKKFEKTAKSKDAKSKEDCKKVLIALGLAYSNLMLTMDGINKQFSKEQTEFDKAMKVLSTIQ